MRPLVLIPAGIVAIALTGCAKTIDSDKTEKTIAGLVRTKIGTQVKRVQCPTDRPATEGKTFTCRVIGDDGSEADATVTATDDDGTVRVSARFLPTDETERSLAAELTTSRSTPVGADCQDIIVARKGVTFDCVIISGGEESRVRARQIDDAGRVRYRPLKGA